MCMFICMYTMTVFPLNCCACCDRSHRFLRAFYVPVLSHANTVYSDYVLLINKQKFKKIVSKLTPEYDTSFI